MLQFQNSSDAISARKIRGLDVVQGQLIQQAVLRRARGCENACASEFNALMPIWTFMRRLTEARKGHWAVTFCHPSITALGFSRAKAVEILIPYDPIGVSALSAAPEPRPGVVQFVLGLFYVPNASSLPWLKWRDLIAVADQPARTRRLRIANLLAKQRFATASARVAWWDALGKEVEPMMKGLIDMVEPFEDPGEGSLWRSTAGDLVEACFALNLLATEDGSGLQLNREGKVRLAEMWANEDPDLAAPRGLLVQLLDRVIRAEGTTG